MVLRIILHQFFMKILLKSGKIVRYRDIRFGEQRKTMDRRSFLSLAVVCSSTLAFGANQKFAPSTVVTNNSSLMVRNLLDKLNTVQNHVGYVQFNTISFDEMLKMAVHCNKPLTPYEVGYIETIFYGDPRRYGFYGERTVPRLTAITPKKDLLYIKQSGHFLLRGAATEKYTTIKKLIGDELILTSGVRAPVKQLHLFLKKIVSEGGDLRLASTSIAPPGFTFHSVGDFDIGKVGYGYGNFSTKFQETDVFKKLYDGGHIAIRYTKGNPFGVRYEPWHIKVTGGNETA